MTLYLLNKLKNSLLIYLIFVITNNVYAQNNEPITVVGDSLVFRSEGIKQFREVYGHVVLTQGAVTIRCNKAIQDILENNAEVIGNVVAVQGEVTITTPRGFYIGNQKKTYSTSGIKLDDKKVILTSEIGEYYFDEDRAFFEKNVKLYDTSTTMTSNKMTYFQKQNRMIAVGNVKVVDKENDITSDTLNYLRYEKVAIADGKVHLFNRSNAMNIYGDHVEDYGKNSYTLANRNPILIQVDTTYNEILDSTTQLTKRESILDTLIIKSNKMQAYRNDINTFIASDSVLIVRKEFSSKNNRTIYYKNDSKIITYKIEKTELQPILWYQTSQLTGDSIAIYLLNNSIKQLDVNKDALILSQNQNYQNRIDQISGDKLNIFFEQRKIKKTDVNGNMFSIYFMYDKDEPNGINKSSAQRGSIYFSEDKVDQVRLYGSPNSEYYPENLVKGKEPSFTLPQFKIHQGKPEKELILKSYFNK